MMSKVVPQPLFAVAPEGLLATKTEPIESLLQTKPQAPVSDIGFYSATEQAALNLGRNKGTGQSFINDLMKAPDVKKEELQFTGLDEFLRDKPNVTKQEVQDFLANNRVDVQEVRLGEAAAEDPIGIAKRKEIFDKYEPQIQALYKDMDSYGYDTPREVLQSTDNRLRKLQEMRDAEADAYYVIPESTPTRYQKYQLAGGENYREILLTLPNKPMEASAAAELYYKNYKQKGGEPNWSELPVEAQQSIIDSMPSVVRNASDAPEYRSSHFNEPNILAHMRVNDRIDADGKKMLLVEEIQSDWHQAGRERGYKTKEGLEKWYNQNKLDDDPSFAELNSEQRSVIERNRDAGMGGDNAVPDAPFKDTWYQLALKRLTKYAAENGYERIGLTTGKQQAERFDLSKQLSRVGYRDGRLQGYDNDGALVMSKSVDPKELPDYVGKELGQKIAVNAEKDAEIRKALRQAIKDDLPEDQIDALRNQLNAIPEEYSGLDLQVGGEGMKKYYDEIYPKFLDKYGKKYGASVGETQITTGYARDASGIPAQRPSKETIRYLDITPQMKEGTSKGQPLFAATPLLPATSLLDEEKRKEITSLLE
jgi:hypothetical protein